MIHYKKLSLFILSIIIIASVTSHVNGTELFEEDIETIQSMVKPSPVYAEITETVSLLTKPHADSVIIKKLEKTQKVELLRDVSSEWYFVMDVSDQKKGWLARASLDIPAEPETDTSRMSKRQLESYINQKDIESKTPYLVWTDISRQLTHIFKRTKQEWRLDRTFECATGKNTSPTIRGIFTAKDRGSWFYSERLKSGGRYWVRFDGSYLYHSLAMDKDKNITDEELGKRKSNGCVRLSVENAAWFFRTIKEGSTIYID